MENDAASALSAQFDELRFERERLRSVVDAYRIVRASRFSRARDVVLALRRLIGRVDEPPALAVLDLPPFSR